MNYKINHIGYLTGDINQTIEVFSLFGYRKWGGLFLDETQKTKICFLVKDGESKIELVEPFEDNEPMRKMLKKRGEGPYHICYEVDDVRKAFEEFCNKDWLPMFEPVPAIAFNNRLICYIFKPAIGYVELLNKG